MDRNLALDFVRVTEAAALASAKMVGKGDGKAADHEATEEMRKWLGDMEIAGKVVIGEGERDEAPMLYIGEELGKGGAEVDIAVDPLECTNSVAKGIPNSICVLAAAPRGSILHAPDIYMNKLAVGPAAKGKVDLDAPVADNIRAVAQALGKDVSEITVMMMDRPRHEKLQAEVIATGARVYLITDGDVAGAIAPSLPNSGVDMLMGIGAAPEGVLAAAALKCMGGEIQARLHFRNEQERERTEKMGIRDLERKYFQDDLVQGDHCFFAATGVTSGPLLDGVRFSKRGPITHSITMSADSGNIRYITTRHAFKKHNK